MKTKTYHVFRAADGCGEQYLGSTTSIREAKRMAAQHARGARGDLPESLYGTARAAGHCAGISAPPKVGEAVEWFGKGGWYCACNDKLRQ